MKNSKRIMALLITVCMLFSVSAFAGTTLATEKITGFYRDNRNLSSWYDVIALWGVNENLDDYTLPNWNSETLTDTSSVTDYAGTILGLIAAGENVHDIWNRDIAEELALKQDTETGSFGEYVNMQVYSMLALDAAKEEYNKEVALSFLVSQEISGGGFGFMATEADVDLTAMTLIALSGTEYADVIDRSVSFLANSQLENGGFQSWGTENSNTLEIVISALYSLDMLEDARFIKDEKTLSDMLEEYILEDGSLAYEKGSDESNLMATQQGLIAFGDIENGSSVFKRLESSYECIPKVTIDCKIRIEGAYNNVLNTDVTVTSINPTVFEAITLALNSNDINYIITTSEYGAYIESINDESAGMFGGWDGWLFLVNGVSLSSSVDTTDLLEDDEILLYYGMFEPETLIPSYTISTEKIMAGTAFTITVESSYINFNSGAIVDVKIEDATVEIDGTKYKTDKNGKAKITVSKAGSYSVQIYKNNENSYPSIVRVVPFEIEVEKKIVIEKVRPKIIIDSNKEKVEETEKPVTTFYLSYIDKSSISEWAIEGVTAAAKDGIIKGDENGLFNPKNIITRAEFATIICRLLNLQNNGTDIQFTDVNEMDWYYESIAAVFGEGIMTGVSVNEFAPNEPVTREQAATVFARAFKIENKQEIEFADNDDISDWAKTAIHGISEQNIMQGYNGQFLPKDSLTREMCAVIGMRILENVKK